MVSAVEVGLSLRQGVLHLLTDRKLAQTTLYDVAVFAPADLITPHLQVCILLDVTDDNNV